MKIKKPILIMILALVLTSCTAQNTNTTDKKYFEKEKTLLERQIAFQTELGDKLYFGMVDKPTNINPFYYEDESSEKIVNTLFDPLINISTKDYNEEIENILLKDLKISDDKMEYTLSLKDDIIWHDGAKMTADDIIYTIDYAIKNTDTRYIKSFYIDDTPVTLTKVDENTVGIKLPRKSNSFKYVLEDLIVVPKHIYEGKEKEISTLEDKEDITVLTNKELLVGNSSYLFNDLTADEFFKTDEFNFVKNEKYYGQLANITNLTYRVVAHVATTRYDMIDYNIQGGYIPNNEVTVFANEAYNVNNIEDGEIASFLFKMNSDYGKNKEVRKAVSNIITSSSVLGNFGDLSNTSIADSVFGVNNEYKSSKPYMKDELISEAVEYLTKLQLKDKDYSLKFGFILDPGEIHEKIAIYLQELFVSLGLKIELVPLFKDEYYEMLENPETKDVDFCLYIYDSFTNPDYYKNLFTKGSNINYSDYTNEELDKLWAEADKTDNFEERSKLYNKIQDILREEKPIIPLVYLDKVLITDNRIVNIEEAVANNKSFFNKINLLDIKEFKYSDEDIKKYDIDVNKIERVPSFDEVNTKKDEVR